LEVGGLPSGEKRRWSADGLIVIATDFDVGVLLSSATLPIGMRAFVSG
jgi:hypothetical protein